MNKIILIGNLTKDADLKFTAGTGNAYAKFTIAVARGFKDKEATDFINCVAFGKMAENIAQFTTKGSKVCVEGSLRLDNYTNKENVKVYTTEVFCNNVEFLSRANTQNTTQNKTTVSNLEVTKNDVKEVFDGVFFEPIDEGDSPF